MMEELLAPKSPAPATISSLLLIITHCMYHSQNPDLCMPNVLTPFPIYLFYNDLELLRLDPHIGTEAGPQQQQYQMLLDRQWKKQPSISHLLEV